MQAIKNFFTIIFTSIIDARMKQVEYYTKTGKYYV